MKQYIHEIRFEELLRKPCAGSITPEEDLELAKLENERVGDADRDEKLFSKKLDGEIKALKNLLHFYGDGK